MIISSEVDGWLKLIGLVGGAGLGTKILVTLIQTRDSIRDFMRDVGRAEPEPTGLFKQVAEIKSDVDAHSDALSKLGFDRRQHDRRG